MSKKITIYMPALNEGHHIFKVLQSVPKIIPGFKELDLLVIDDGSTDNTSEESIRAGATVINHKENKGLGGAFQSALTYALRTKSDILVSIDSDGQFDVLQIEDLITPILKEEADFSIGNRFCASKPDNMPWIKYWGNRQISRIVSLIANNKIVDASCGFRAYSRECVLSLNLQGNFTYTHETILDLLDKDYKVSQVPVHVKYFDGRISRMANNLFRYTFKTLVIMFKCLKDYKPIQFFLGIALFVFFIAILTGGYVFFHWIDTGAITPYKSIGVIALALIGMAVLLTTIAFMADMLNRIRRNQEKMLYLLKRNYSERN